MKKTLLLFAAAFTFSAAHAQVSVIPKAGLSIAWQHFEETRYSVFNKKTIQHNAGLVTGVGFNIPVGKDNRLFFQPELLYIQKGYRLKFANKDIAITDHNPNVDIDLSAQVDNKNVINHLEVPLLGQVRFGTEQFKIFAMAGPSVAFALNGRYVWDASSSSYAERSEGRIRFKQKPENANENDWYLDPSFGNRLDIGIQAGAGCGLAAGPGMLQFEARYGHSLIPYFESSDANRVFAFTLGYAIPLGGKQ